MAELVHFDKLRERNLVAYHLVPGQSVIIGAETLVAELSDKFPRFQCVKPFHPFVVPPGSMWFAVSLRSFRLDLGYHEILPYHLENWPDQTFQLGLNCSMQLHVAHLSGLVKCIRDRPILDEMELRRVVRESTVQVIRNVINRSGLLQLEYSQWTKEKRSIEQLAEHQLFPLLYDSGLCMSHKSFLIHSFAKPSIKIDNWG